VDLWILLVGHGYMIPIRVVFWPDGQGSPSNAVQVVGSTRYPASPASIVAEQPGRGGGCDSFLHIHHVNRGVGHSS
jgi:hypothetical protein